jgi:hypothetical protein
LSLEGGIFNTGIFSPPPKNKEGKGDLK